MKKSKYTYSTFIIGVLISSLAEANAGCALKDFADNAKTWQTILPYSRHKLSSPEDLDDGLFFCKIKPATNGNIYAQKDACVFYAIGFGGDATFPPGRRSLDIKGGVAKYLEQCNYEISLVVVSSVGSAFREISFVLRGILDYPKQSFNGGFRYVYNKRAAVSSALFVANRIQ